MVDFNTDRFWNKVNKTESCWLWIGAKGPDDYGHFWLDGGQKYSHRVSWELFNGKIPDDLLVCHKCDVRSCVNPDHLFLGTYLDNNHDRSVKGRSADVRGENAGNSKLKWNEIFQIREMYSSEQFSQRELAKLFKVSQRNIWAIVHNKIWQ